MTGVLLPNPILVASSLLFIIPVAMAKDWAVFNVSMFLALISSMYHATKNLTLFWVDQVAVYIYVIYISYRLNMIGKNLEWFIPILYSTIVYHIGYLNKRFIWSTNPMEANISHVSMHLSAVYPGIALCS
jgi:hypothetical protein